MRKTKKMSMNRLLDNFNLERVSRLNAVKNVVWIEITLWFSIVFTLAVSFKEVPQTRSLLFIEVLGVIPLAWLFSFLLERSGGIGMAISFLIFSCISTVLVLGQLIYQGIALSGGKMCTTRPETCKGYPYKDFRILAFFHVLLSLIIQVALIVVSARLYSMMKTSQESKQEGTLRNVVVVSNDDTTGVVQVTSTIQPSTKTSTKASSTPSQRNNFSSKILSSAMNQTK